MIQSPRRIEPADPVQTFSCGHTTLDKWLAQQALRAERDRTATTYVVIDDGRVAGYYSLAAHSVGRASIGGGRLTRNSPDPVPALLLARLAVDIAWQGRRIGSDLLAHAITIARAAGSLIGLRAIVVDPIDDNAISFYTRYGFKPFPARPERLFYPL